MEVQTFSKPGSIRPRSDIASLIDEIGSGAVPREDDAYILGSGALLRHHIPGAQRLPFVEGDTVRDYSISNPSMALWPYDASTLTAFASQEALRLLWPGRAVLRGRVAYGQTQIERGLEWFEYSMFFRNRFKVNLIVFAFVATQNHFALDRGGKIFKHWRP